MTDFSKKNTLLTTLEKWEDRAQDIVNFGKSSKGDLQGLEQAEQVLALSKALRIALHEMHAFEVAFILPGDVKSIFKEIEAVMSTKDKNMDTSDRAVDEKLK